MGVMMKRKQKKGNTKMKNQSKEEIRNLIAYANETGEKLYIISGEGEIGTREEYAGKMTAHAIAMRLARERAGGDRWARCDTAQNHELLGIAHS